MAYTDLTAAITAKVDEFKSEAEKGETNKAAAGRARKVSTEIGKMMKEYRATSIVHHKK